ncbi:MAG: hypothetical protein HY282_08820 [Nitrospirae bacterium]|nr:hypothetical protein [Candidatus Manganitrophaceae bacterium]
MINVEDFREASLQLDNSLAEANLISFPIRLQRAELAADILSFSPVFREIHIKAVQDCVEQTRLFNVLEAENPIKHFDTLGEMQDNFTDKESREKLDRYFDQSKQLMRMTDKSSASLRVGYKAFFYFIRTYHDSLYKTLLSIIRQQAGRASAMTDTFDHKKKEFKLNNPVAQIIRTSYPDYINWFLSWREKRNAIKTGVGIAYIGPSYDLGISFNKLNENGEFIPNFEVIRITDVISALTASTKITSIAQKEVIHRIH